MYKYHHSLILFLLATGISSFAYKFEQSGLVRQSVTRKRSPLAYESHIFEGPDVIDEQEMGGKHERQDLIPLRREPLRISSMTRLRHQKNGYEVILQLAPITKWPATAVINPYNRTEELSQASIALYTKCGQEFLAQLDSLLAYRPALFDELVKQPGNSLLLSSDCFSLGDLPMDNMFLIYVPQAVKPKTQVAVLAALSAGIREILTHQIYPLLERSNIDSASIVLPAICAGPAFRGYQGPLAAKMLFSAVVTALRYLHGLGCSRLQYVSFVVDTQETYEDYQKIFNEFFQQERDYFTRLETPTDIENWE